MKKDTFTRELSLTTGWLWCLKWARRNHRIRYWIGQLLLRMVVRLMQETPTFTYDNGVRLYYLNLPARKNGATP